MENSVSREQEDYNYYIDNAQILKRYLESTDVTDENSSEYYSKIEAYTEIIEEIQVRINNFSNDSIVKNQAVELINEYEEKKKYFEEKYNS